MSARRAALLAVAAGLWLLAASLLWRTRVPGELQLAHLRPELLFSGSHLEAADDYTGPLRALWLGSTAAGLVLLWSLARAGPRLAGRLRGTPLVRSLALLVAVLTALWLVRLPFAAAGHWWRRRHDISRQPYLDWLVSPWLELAGSLLVACVALALAIALARRLGDRWWLAGGPLLALLGAAALLAQPLLLLPRLEPLRDEALAGQIQRLARLQGLPRVRLEVKRASELTTRANAELAGLGPTRRVVLWDTLLDGRFPPAEIRAVSAHELAHASRHHLLKGLGWFALAAVPGVFLVAAVSRRRGGIDDPGNVPAVVLTVVLCLLAAAPGANVVSRRYEAEADWIALETTRDPGALEGLLRRFSTTGLTDPSPPGWASALLGTHPSTVDRIALARAWRDARGALRREGPPAGS
ncbi:MAG: M48 family metalloprotease [Actinobacteria bacterium]|nr:M48 family metalloprotease [Actinomycetota bacterium]